MHYVIISGNLKQSLSHLEELLSAIGGTAEGKNEILQKLSLKTHQNVITYFDEQPDPLMVRLETGRLYIWSVQVTNEACESKQDLNRLPSGQLKINRIRPSHCFCKDMQ